MPKWSMEEKSANRDSCTMLKCPKCQQSSWYVFVFKETLEFHCKTCDEHKYIVNNLETFTKVEYREIEK
jgi:hypothetical protein